MTEQPRQTYDELRALTAPGGGRREKRGERQQPSSRVLRKGIAGKARER